MARNSDSEPGIARCNNRDVCNASGHIAHGAGLRVSGEFGQVVEVNLTKLVPGNSNGIVELQYHANLPYRQNVEGERNIVVLKKYRFNFRGFVPNGKYKLIYYANFACILKNSCKLLFLFKTMLIIISPLMQNCVPLT